MNKVESKLREEEVAQGKALKFTGLGVFGVKRRPAAGLVLTHGMDGRTKG